MEERKAREQPPRTKGDRYREVMATLARHGLGLAGDRHAEHRGMHVRQAFEELGTTFIKLGQVLSTRGDLIGEPYRAELLKLQDAVPASPTGVIEEVIRAELGGAPQELFAYFDPVPIGSASIAQVHAARLADGRDIALKVQRPGVDQLVEIDLAILNDLVEQWHERWSVLEEYDARGMVREFSDTLRTELDYTREAENVRMFRRIFEKERGFALPDVLSEFSTSRVLTLTLVQGVKAGQVEMPKRRRSSVSRRIGRFVLEPIFSHGVFHADPHAGNFAISPDGAVGVMDFGMIGRLTPDSRRRVAGLFMAIARGDAQRLTDAVVELTAPTRPIDRAALSAEMDRLLQRYLTVSLEEVQFGPALSDLIDVLRRHGLRLPANLAMLFKALTMCEGLLEEIDPDSSFADHLEPLAKKLVLGSGSSEEWAERMRDSARDAAELSIELPRRIDRVMGEVERGNVRVWTRVEDMDDIIRRFERTVERANATMLASACIVGVAIIMLFYHPQGWQTWIGAIFWLAVAGAVVHIVRTLIALRR